MYSQRRLTGRWALGERNERLRDAKWGHDFLGETSDDGLLGHLKDNAGPLVSGRRVCIGSPHVQQARAASRRPSYINKGRVRGGRPCQVEESSPLRKCKSKSTAVTIPSTFPWPSTTGRHRPP